MPVLIVFIIAALIFGVGGVIKGVLWAMLIGLLLLIVAAGWGWQSLSNGRRSR